MTHRTHRQADQPRRRPRQGDGRGEVRRRVRHARASPTAGSSPAPSPGGRSPSIDASEALKLPGRDPGLHAREHARASRGSTRSYRDQIAPPGSPFRPLYDAEVQFSAQPVALVVADSLELARYASTLVRVEYETRRRTPRTWRPTWRRPTRRRSGTASSRRRSRAATPTRPSPRPPCGSTRSTACRSSTTTRWRCSRRRWSGTRTARSPSTTRPRACRTSATTSATCSATPTDDLRVVSPFVGGAFGSGLRPQYQVFLAVLAARELKRSVRVVADPPADVQPRAPPDDPAARGARRVAPTARSRRSSTRRSPRPRGSRTTARTVVNWSGLLYRCDNVRLDHKVVPLDLPTPCDMRAPGAVWGVFALECAMDELAVKLGIDPVELRLKNYAEEDQNDGKPFSSKELRECYRQGAERFGWARRDPSPRSMRRGLDARSAGAWPAAPGRRCSRRRRRRPC